MGFINGLPRTLKGYDYIWVTVDRLKKSAHFLQVKTTYNGARYVHIYIDKIVRLHRLLISIISDSGS